VVAVNVDVCGDVSLIETDVGERLQVGGLDAPEGVVVTAQVSETVPVNEFDGVTVMSEVPVESGLTVMLPLLVRLKLALLLPPPGACQKFPHPARSGVAASSIFAHVPILIPAPCFLACRVPLKGNFSRTNAMLLQV
jgi:hypothetical protein